MIPGSSSDADAVDLYLDHLLAALRGTAHDIRRTITECEAHLRDETERRVAEGMNRSDAAEAAVASFGGVSDVAGGFNRAHSPAALRSVVPVAAFHAWRVTAVGLVAIGISGLISWVLAAAAGTSAVFADAPGTRYDRAGCAHFLAVQPSAKTCAAAALLEGRDDVITQRAAAGVLGILLLIASFWWQRRGQRNRPQPVVDLRAPAALVAVTVFGAAGVVLTGYGIDRAVINTGSGQWIAAGVVALAVAAGYLGVLYHAPQHPIIGSERMPR